MTRTLAITLILVALPVAVAAQTQPTPQQVELHDRGYDAMVAGDFPAAVGAYRASLELGELNISWLNLGRAYHKQGLCSEAWDAFARVSDAPKVASPNKKVVGETLQRFRAELLDDCPTGVRVECGERGPEPVFVDGVGVGPCDETLLTLPGPHSVRRGTMGATKEVDLLPGEIALVEFDDPRADPQTETRPRTTVAGKTAAGEIDRLAAEIPHVEGAKIDGWGIVLVGTGVAIGATSLLFDGVIPYFPRTAWNREFDTTDVLPVVGYVVAVGAIAWGIVRLVR